MFTLKDRRGSTVCLGLGHEEVITDMVRKEVSSYKQLPKKLYQIQTKLRDEPRPRFGLLRAREFLMMDAYSFDVDEVGFSASYQVMEEAYHAVCKRIGLRVRCVEADAKAMGESDCRDFMVLADVGEPFVLCEWCDYAATQERGESRLEVSPQERARRLVSRDRISLREAEKIIKEKDGKTKQIYEKLYGFKLGEDFSPFDLVLGTERLSSKDVLDTLSLVINRLVLKRDDEVINAVDN